MKKLSYFKGKLCTVLTRPASRFFEDAQHANVFVGLIDDVDEFGVWLLQLNNKKRSFFFAHSLVGIIEEKITFISEEEADMIKTKLSAPETPQSDLVQIDRMKLLKKAANKGNQ